MKTESPLALIADDQPDVTEALRLLLKREGYQTEAVHSPADVLDRLRERAFDVLLMDLNYTRDTTSGAEGLDLLGRIRRLDHSLPVVVMTAWASIPLAVEAMRRGARDFVEKPWDNQQLLSTLRTQMGRRSSRRAAAREELREAAATQQGLLPQTIPLIPGYDLAAAWAPMREIGGDYLDLIPLEDGRLGIAVGDVSGKGMPAALLMSNLQAAVRTLAPDVASPADLAVRVNGVAGANLASNKFITLFYGVIEGRRLTYTNAGHHAPLLIHGDGSSERLEAGGPLLGVFHDCRYQQAEVDLCPGDRLLLYTDGIVEAEDRDGAEFGEGRLLALAVANRGLDASGLRRQVMATVARFTGGAFQDDATLLAVAVD